MSDDTLFAREERLVAELRRLAAERAAGEHEAVNVLPAKGAAIGKQYRAEVQENDRKYKIEVEKAEEDRSRTLAAKQAEFESTRDSLTQEYEKLVKNLERRVVVETKSAKDEFGETRWNAGAILEAAKTEEKKRFEKTQRELADLFKIRDDLDSEARGLISEHRKLVGTLPDPLASVQIPGSEDPRPRLADKVRAIEEHIQAFRSLTVLKLLRVDNFIALFILIAVLLAYPTWLLAGLPYGPVADAVVVGILAVAARTLLNASAKSKVAKVAAPMLRDLVDSAELALMTKDYVTARNKAVLKELEETRERDVRAAENKARYRVETAESARDDGLRDAREKYPPRIASLTSKYEDLIRSTEERAKRIKADAQARHDVVARALKESYDRLLGQHKNTIDAQWKGVARAWEDGLFRIGRETEDLERDVSSAFPTWSEIVAKGWKPPTESPNGIRFGEYRLEARGIPNWIPNDDDLKQITPPAFQLRAYLTLPDRWSMLLKAAEEGRDRAVNVLQAVMLRMLTSIPPGKVRFTIIDPVGLGQNFAPFMHLTDYDEAVVNHRIWTEAGHIEQRLADLTEHMETVIQTFLRNDYATIEEYNAQAGEVAEPYRILVVANFPTNWSEEALRRLAGIASGGAKCGVHFLIAADSRLPMPFGFNIKDLESQAITLVWKEGRFVWRDPKYESLRLVLDAPADSEEYTKIMHDVGRQSKDARRVEVPFELIAPEGALWTQDSRGGVDVPLGRAGATKLQNLKLGKGTSQHVLIAGKTGSGKSTLLHALITNVSLRYSPNEMELFLIDFKKGVEFKTYATQRLPHARVVAIESEREFGLSVLQRLDQEMKRRGDLFRDAGAQDVASFRDASGGLPLPRMLLIVDEFQEFFIEDDKLAQECSLLLDRLVRQGRAFGIHVILGSQTLSGAYSLARSTLGQMAVRVALQCSESDAHLILSEDNTAARLLSRPGEAIYNDANGLIEGNHVFQVVWLNDDRREAYLKQLRALAVERDLIPAEPQVVFEGNVAAEISRNAPLARLLDSETWPVDERAVSAWLGDAVAIKEPTCATFRAQSGSNLLLIGQQEESAIGVLSATLVSLAAQHAPNRVVFYLLDGTPADYPLAGSLGRLANNIPHAVNSVGHRESAKTMKRLAAEVDRRRREEDYSAPNIFVIIHDLNRFRDLRKKDDDYGFSSYGEEKQESPAKQFVTILRDGPIVGVHSIVWCDTVNNLTRSLDRQAVSEFEMRVLFQMSMNDSSTLIDSPVAGKLGTHRAYFFSEEQATLEKFRPYGLPSETSLEDFRTKFSGKPHVSPALEPAPPESDASRGSELDEQFVAVQEPYADEAQGVKSDRVSE